MRKKPDQFLSQPLASERFELIPLDFKGAYNATWLWTANQQDLLYTTFNSSPRTKWQWFREMDRPDGRTTFYHAIRPKSGKGVIGTHRIVLNSKGTAKLACVVHARKWWGKDVFFEARSAIMDHFFQSDRIERMQGNVHVENQASIYNYMKLGFRCVGEFRKGSRDKHTGNYFNVLAFEMLKVDWMAK